MNYPFWSSHKDPQDISFFTKEDLQDYYLDTHEVCGIPKDEPERIAEQTTLTLDEVEETLEYYDDPSDRISDLRRDVIAEIGSYSISPRGYVARFQW